MAYPTKGSLFLSKATIDDLPNLLAIFPRAFHDVPINKKMIPDTPATREWWHKSHKTALLDPKTHFVIVTDRENGEIVGLARWLLPRDDGGPQPGSEEDRWPENTDDMDKDIADSMFGGMKRSRKELMGDRKHYFLEFIGTVREYQGRGAGSLMMRYGCEMADKDGLEIFVDATMEGYPMYLKYGFVLKAEDPMADGWDYVMRYLIRPAKKQVDS